MLCLSLLIGLAFKDTAGRSVFPLSPIEILWILIITSAFPAFGLGAERASPDILHRPPHNRRWGVFSPEILVDIGVIGIFGTISTIVTFVVVIWGANGGALGRESGSQSWRKDWAHADSRDRRVLLAGSQLECLPRGF